MSPVEVRAMRVGVNFFPTAESIDPRHLGEELESRGFDALFLAEHSHIPVSRATPWGGRENAPPLPMYYAETLDSLVTLGAVAGVTDRLRLATGISLVAQHDPIWLAKQVATVDYLSDGRFEFGIGYGWNKEEMASHGVEYLQRRDLVGEYVGLMKALWTEEEASYDGEHVRLEPSWAWPKPVQKPHPPVILGSAPGPRTIRALVEYCDAWMPIVGRGDVEAALAPLHAALAEAGRDPGAFEITLYQAAADPEAWRTWSAQGVGRVLLQVPSAPADVVVPLLDEWIALREQL